MSPEEQAAFDALTAERDTLAGQVGSLTTERDTARGDYREFRHATEFKRMARERGVKPKALETFYRESGYTADGDDVDVDAISAVIDARRDDLDYCFEPPASSTPTPTPTATPTATPTPTPTRPAPGASRGAEPPRVASKFRVTVAQTGDARWMADNWAAYTEASKAGRLEIVNQ